MNAQQAQRAVESADLWAEQFRDQVIVTRASFLNVQVCSTVHDPEELTRIVNMILVCGTSAGWVLTDNPEQAPVVCASDPSKKHYIFDA